MYRIVLGILVVSLATCAPHDIHVVALPATLLILYVSAQVPRLRADAVARVCRSLLECYEMVYNMIEDPRSGYLEQGGANVVKHTPAQVRTILGVV
jgi:hypothetical protein